MKKTIFYVDDDQDDLDLFASVAEELNLSAMLFDDGHILLDAVHEPPFNPTIIFIDLNMPKLSGYEVLKRLKQQENENCVPIVLTTAGDNSTISRCRDLGAKMFVQKPTSIQKLKATLQYIVVDWESHQLHGANFIYEA